MKSKLKLFLICIAFVPELIHAQNVNVLSELEKDTALIGEQFSFGLRLESDKSLSYAFPDDEFLFPPAFEILSESADSLESEGKNLYQFNYLLTVFDSGSYTFSSIPVYIQHGDFKDTIFTEELSIRINSPVVDTTAAVKDIKQPVNTPFSLEEVYPEVVYILIALVLITMAVFLYSRFRKKKNGLLPEKTIPPHLVALKELDRIKKEKIWQRGETKDYYSQLSNTIRTYIENRYGLPAMESVTTEIIADFKGYTYDDETLLEILEDLLVRADEVKFAKAEPSPGENETSLSNAYIFIEKTRPIEQIDDKNINSKE